MEARRRGEGSSTRGGRGWGDAAAREAVRAAPEARGGGGRGCPLRPASGGVEPCHPLRDRGPPEPCTRTFLSFGATKFEVTSHGNNGKPAPEIDQFRERQRWEILKLSPRTPVPENREHFTVLPKRSPAESARPRTARREPPEAATGIGSGRRGPVGTLEGPPPTPSEGQGIRRPRQLLVCGGLKHPGPKQSGGSGRQLSSSPLLPAAAPHFLSGDPPHPSAGRGPPSPAGHPEHPPGGASLIPRVTWSHGAALLLSLMWVTHVLCGSPQSLPAKFFVVCVCLK